jgi:hypothetical protein
MATNHTVNETPLERIRQKQEREEQHRVWLDALLNEHDVARITGMSLATARRWRLLRRGPRYRRSSHRQALKTNKSATSNFRIHRRNSVNELLTLWNESEVTSNYPEPDPESLNEYIWMNDVLFYAVQPIHRAFYATGFGGRNTGKGAFISPGERPRTRGEQFPCRIAARQYSKCGTQRPAAIGYFPRPRAAGISSCQA